MDRLVDRKTDRWMDGGWSYVCVCVCVCVCVTSTVLYFAYLQFYTSDGPIVEVPSPLPAAPYARCRSLCQHAVPPACNSDLQHAGSVTFQ